MPDLLPIDTAEAAKRLGLSKSTLNKARLTGKGPPYVKVLGGRVRYRPADLDAWLEARVVRNTSQDQPK